LESPETGGRRRRRRRKRPMKQMSGGRGPAAQDQAREDLQLPPGFRFHPTDEELVMHYLCRRCAGLPISARIIAEIDLYKHDPWQLPSEYLLRSQSTSLV
jgi:hypothetical protein